jgi:hypothetical protein
LFNSRIIPEAYSEDTSLIDILLERYPNYDIYWYHWPRDGWAIIVEDYEPVILIYSEDTLCAVTVRKGWRFNTTDTALNQIPFPLRISFDPFQHHPLVITNNQNHASLNNISPLNGNIVNILKDDIPLRFRIGRTHPTNFKIFDQTDPLVYADYLYNEFYKKNI